MALKTSANFDAMKTVRNFKFGQTKHRDSIETQLETGLHRHISLGRNSFRGQQK